MMDDIVRILTSPVGRKERKEILSSVFRDLGWGDPTEDDCALLENAIKELTDDICEMEPEDFTDIY